MIVIQLLFSLAWVAIALRTERSAPFLRTAWICFALSTAALALARLSEVQGPGALRTGDFAATILFFVLALVAYFSSHARKEPQKARRWLWDRSYAE